MMWRATFNRVAMFWEWLVERFLFIYLTIPVLTQYRYANIYQQRLL